MIRFYIIKGFLLKEFKQMFRDPRMRVVLFGAPLIMLLLFGYAVNTDVKQVKMVVLDEDKTKESRELIEKFTSSGYFLHYADIDSEKKADAFLDRGEAEMFLHIHADFSKNVRSGKVSELQLVVDGTDSSRAAVIVAQINGLTADFSFNYFRNKIRLYILAMESQGFRMKKPVELKERILFNPDLASRNFFLPGILGMIIVMTTMTLTSMSIVKERETGTIEQITVSPVRPAEFIAGKVIPFALVSFFDTFVITLIEIFWFRVPFNGSFLLLLLTALVFVFSTTAVGLFISTVSKTQQQALLSVFLFFMPALMFSGFVFPIYAMPVPIQIISFFNPVRYFMTLIRGIFLKGVGLEVLWLDLLLLALLGAGLFYLSVRRFKSRME